jgi:hypothetical protein
MDEQEKKEVEESLPPAPDEVTISLVLGFIDKSEEDGKCKFVSTFYANNARYMEINADQIHLTDRMRAIMREIVKVGTTPPKESCSGDCACKKGGLDV